MLARREVAARLEHGNRDQRCLTAERAQDDLDAVLVRLGAHDGLERHARQKDVVENDDEAAARGRHWFAPHAGSRLKIRRSPLLRVISISASKERATTRAFSACCAISRS